MSDRRTSRPLSPKGQLPPDRPLPHGSQQKTQFAKSSVKSTTDDKSQYNNKSSTNDNINTRDNPSHTINDSEMKKNPTRKARPDLQPMKGPHTPSNAIPINRAGPKDTNITVASNRKIVPLNTEGSVFQEVHDQSGNWKEGVKALQDQSRGKSRESATGEAWDLNKGSGVYRKLPFQQNRNNSSRTVTSKDPVNSEKAMSETKSPVDTFPDAKTKQHVRPLPEISQGLPKRKQENSSKLNSVQMDGAKNIRGNKTSSKPNQGKPIWNAAHKPKGKSKTELAKAYARGVARLQTFAPKPNKVPKGLLEEENEVISRAPSRIDEISNDDQSSENEDNKTKPEEDDKEEEKELVEQPKEGLIIEVSNCNITDLEAEVVVSVDSEDLQGTGKIAQELDAKGGEDFVVLKTLVMQMYQQTIPEWDFFVSPGDGDLTCKRVFHAHVPSLHKTKNQAAWCSHLGILVWNIMTRADYMGFSSMALPLLGSGESGAPASFVIPVICNEIQSFSDGRKKGGYLSKIIVMHPQSNVTKQVENRLLIPPKQTNIKSRSYKHCPFCNTKVDQTSSTETKQLSCRHLICKSCAKRRLSDSKCMCPICKTEGKVVKGTQPKGFMLEAHRMEDLPGFRNCGTIHMCYLFGDGTQQDCHPNPGKRYRGVSRYAFLPDSRQGRKVYRLLRRAFELGLTFTIQKSATGQEDMIVWCDIPHKINIHGGPNQSGYPDPGYLSYVERELGAKGIIEHVTGQNIQSIPSSTDDRTSPKPYNLDEI